jgi:hypothetical protein
VIQHFDVELIDKYIAIAKSARISLKTHNGQIKFKNLLLTRHNTDLTSSEVQQIADVANDNAKGNSN